MHSCAYAIRLPHNLAHWERTPPQLDQVFPADGEKRSLLSTVCPVESRQSRPYRQSSTVPYSHVENGDCNVFRTL